MLTWFGTEANLGEDYSIFWEGTEPILIVHKTNKISCGEICVGRGLKLNWEGTKAQILEGTEPISIVHKTNKISCGEIPVGRGLKLDWEGTKA